ASIPVIPGGQHVMATGGQAPGKAAPADTINTEKVDIEQLSKNIVCLIEQGGKAMAACLKPRDRGPLSGETVGREVMGIIKTFGDVVEYWLAHPHRAIAAQVSLGKGYVDLWAATTGRILGEPPDPVVRSDPKDRRFADPEWSANPFFDVLKQAYLLTA